MLGYRINNSFFYNPYAAMVWAAHHHRHVFPDFCVYDDVFSACDWTHDPVQSWYELMKIRATMLRQKYDRLILAFSGGTDSITCYGVFRDLNIHIDEILVTYSDDSLGNAPKENATWLIQNHYDPKTKITVWHRQDTSKFNYDRSDWYLSNHGDLRRFELTLPGPHTHDYLQETHGHTSWALITGHEKPALVYKNQRWWATHLDGVYHAVMGWPNVEMFFVSPDLPELHIKQHHMLLSQIKTAGIKPTEGWNSLKDLGKNLLENYYWLATACGRQIDITPGCSFNQKKYNQHTKLQEADLLLSKKIISSPKIEPLLKSCLNHNDTLAKTYINGWRDLHTDQTLISYMTKHQLLSHKNQTINDYSQIWGKCYPLEQSS
jgi:hypothetical protein